MANIASLNKSLSSIGSGKYSVDSLNKKLSSIDGSGLFSAPLKLGKFLVGSVSKAFDNIGINNSEKNVPSLLKKLYAFMKKTREEDLRNRALENSFKEEERMEETRRYESLLNAIKTYTKIKPVEDTEEKESFFSRMMGWAADLLKSVGGLFAKISDWSVSLLGAVGAFFNNFKSMLGSLLNKMAKNILKPLASFLINKIIFGTVRGLLFGILGRLVLALSPWLLAIGIVSAAAKVLDKFALNFADERAPEQVASRLRFGNEGDTAFSPGSPQTARTITQKELGLMEKMASKESPTNDQGVRAKLSLYKPEALDSVRSGEKRLVSVPLLTNTRREVKLLMSDQERLDMAQEWDVIKSARKKGVDNLSVPEKKEYSESQLKILAKTQELIPKTYAKKGTTASITNEEEQEITKRITLLRNEVVSLNKPDNISSDQTSVSARGDRDIGAAMAKLTSNEPSNNANRGLIIDNPFLGDEEQPFGQAPVNISSTTMNGKSTLTSWDSTNVRDTLGTFMVCTRNNFAPL